MIYTLNGDIGGGKTLQAIGLIKLATDAGRMVMTDIVLTDRCPFADKVMQIGTPEFPVAEEHPGPDQKYKFFWQYALDFPNALIVLDEADIEFDSADYQWFAKDCKIYNKQCRKFGHDVVYIVQRLSNLYKRIRDMAGRHILCEHNYRTDREFRWIEAILGKQTALNMSRFLKSEYSDPTLKVSRGGGYFSYREARPMFGWYNTQQLLGSSLEIIRGSKTHAHDLGRSKRASPAGLERRGRDGSRRDGPAFVAAKAEALVHDGGAGAGVLRGLRDLGAEVADHGNEWSAGERAAAGAELSAGITSAARSLGGDCPEIAVDSLVEG